MWFTVVINFSKYNTKQIYYLALWKKYKHVLFLHIDKIFNTTSQKLNIWLNQPCSVVKSMTSLESIPKKHIVPYVFSVFYSLIGWV